MDVPEVEAAPAAGMSSSSSSSSPSCETVDARLGDLARLSEQVRNLTALRDDLEKQAQDAAVRAATASAVDASPEEMGRAAVAAAA